MRYAILILVAPVFLICLVCFGQVPQTTQLWNFNQFRNVLGVMQIKNGATLTNSMIVNPILSGATNTGTFTTGSLIVGAGGSAIQRVYSVLVTNEFGMLGTLGTTFTNFTVLGANTNDNVIIGLPEVVESTTLFQGFVSATNTVTVQAFNMRLSATYNTNRAYRITIIRF